MVYKSDKNRPAMFGCMHYQRLSLLINVWRTVAKDATGPDRNIGQGRHWLTKVLLCVIVTFKRIYTAIAICG